MLVFALPLLTFVVTQVSGHGQLTVPAPRPDIRGDIRSASQREPSFTLDGIRPTTGGGGSRGYFETDFRCRGYGRDERQERATLRAGEEFTIEWRFEANHPGDCFLYVSLPGQEISAPEYWFKILSIPGCGSTDANTPAPPNFNRLTFTVPEGIPACEECVLRWEWYAVQQVTNIEFYNQCADITVINDLGVGEVDPSSVVSISGTQHLPQSANQYRRAYDREFGPEFLVGPEEAILTLSNSGNGSDGNNEEQQPTATTTTIVVPTPTTTPEPPIVEIRDPEPPTVEVQDPEPPTVEVQDPEPPTVEVQDPEPPTVEDTVPAEEEDSVVPEIEQPPVEEEDSEIEQPAVEEEREYACSFDEAGALLNQWNGGFVINTALFSTCAGTTIEFDWVEGSGGCYAYISNYWNADVEVFNDGKTVKFTTLYDYSPFGFQAKGTFAIENLKVNGESCSSSY